MSTPSMSDAPAPRDAVRQTYKRTVEMVRG